MKKGLLLLHIAILFSHSVVKSQNIYFPPLNNSANWDTISPASLGWCESEIEPLYQFLSQENTKGFIVLKNGKIVLEKYFGTFSKDSLWYWASAGKTITSFLVGKAQEEGFLSIEDPSSKFQGVGWTSCNMSQEAKIKIRNQLTMTSGLDDGVTDNHCVADTCLVCLANPDSRWAYHNAPYTLLEKVLVNATKQNINIFTQSRLLTKTGMTGLWLTVDYDNVFFSKARSMARYGLLFQNKCIWNNDTLLHDQHYLDQMTNTSQNINLSYGYLWWLNGKASYMVPTLQTVFKGSFAPSAPADMFAGIGKNGQLVCVSPSQGIVLVRMGNSPSTFGEVPTIFCNQIWQKLNAIICNSTFTKNEIQSNSINIYPNPAHSEINIVNQNNKNFDIEIYDLLGNLKFKKLNQNKVDISDLTPGTYILKFKIEHSIFTQKWIKI